MAEIKIDGKKVFYEVTGKGEKENTFVGTWGNFPLDIKEDNYIIAPL